jgi:hypothetical protein
MMFKPSKEDAMNHEIFLGNGAFHLPSGAASFAQDGPNVTTTPAWSSQLGSGDAAGWDSIDPALLSSSGARSGILDRNSKRAADNAVNQLQSERAQCARAQSQIWSCDVDPSCRNDPEIHEQIKCSGSRTPELLGMGPRPHSV